MVIIETLQNTEKYRRKTRKEFDNDVDLFQQPISIILWFHQKLFINLTM